MPDLVLQQRGALPSATTQGHPLEDRRRPFDRHSADSHPRGSSSTWSRLRACRRTVVRVTAEGQATRTTRGDEDSAAEVFPLIRVSGPCGYPKTSGNDLALVTTDLTATPEEIIARYAARWSIEVTFFDVKNILGVGQARNRVTKAVERTVPFGLFCYSLLIIWYTLHGHASTDVARRRALAPWYGSKAEPATLDMLTSLRRQIIAARFLPTSPQPATTEEILEVQQAWALAAA